MTYNITIKNNGALPIPYVIRVGDQIAAESLYKDKELHCDALFIGATPQHQLLIHCTKVDYIFQPDQNLEINLNATQKPVSATD